MRILLLLFFIASANQVWAENSCEDMQQVLQLGLNDKTVYTPGACNSNVRNLLNLFTARGGDIADARVVLMLRERYKLAGGIPANRVMAPNFFGGKPAPKNTQFSYHAVVVAKNRVFDFDFGPVAKSTRDYANEMFGRPTANQADPNNVNVPARIDVISVPAKTYLDKWTEIAADITAKDPHQTRDHGVETRMAVYQFFTKQAGSEAYPLMTLEQLGNTPL